MLTLRRFSGVLQQNGHRSLRLLSTNLGSKGETAPNAREADTCSKVRKGLLEELEKALNDNNQDKINKDKNQEKIKEIIGKLNEAQRPSSNSLK